MSSLIILNPEAGRVRKSLTRVRGRLADHLASADGEVRVARAWEETRDQASAATEAGFDRVVAAGGDGTVNAVVNGLMEGPEPRPTLAVLPLGTGNDLARSLAIDPDLEGGLRSLERNDRRLMDLIAVQRSDVRRIAANVSAGGFSGQVDGSLTGEAKERWGPLAYLKTAVEQLPEADRYETVLEMEGEAGSEEHALTLANVVAANGRWAAGGIQVAPRARLDDGRMDVVVLRAAPVARMGLAAATVAAGEPLEHELVETYRTRKLSVESEPAMPFNVDGELLGAGPIRFEVIPEAVRVLVGSENAPAFRRTGGDVRDPRTSSTHF